MVVYLTTTNKKAAFINNKYLSKIKSEEVIFSAEIENIEEDSKDLPTEKNLIIKKGSQVMMVNNDSQGRWINGSIGIVDDIKSNSLSTKIQIYVKFSNGRIEYVEPYKWELFKYNQSLYFIFLAANLFPKTIHSIFTLLLNYMFVTYCCIKPYF
jgi:hypothetical protein